MKLRGGGGRGTLTNCSYFFLRQMSKGCGGRTIIIMVGHMHGELVTVDDAITIDTILSELLPGNHTVSVAHTNAFHSRGRGIEQYTITIFVFPHIICNYFICLVSLYADSPLGFTSLYVGCCDILE
jgi:hypothetical protein